MDQLTRLLRDSDVEVRERRFSSVRGVDGLDQPFVSLCQCKYYANTIP